MKTMKNIRKVINPYDYGYELKDGDVINLYRLVRTHKKSGFNSVLVANCRCSGHLTVLRSDWDMAHSKIVCNINQLDTRSYDGFVDTLQTALYAATNGTHYDADIISVMALLYSDITDISDEADPAYKAKYKERCEQDIALAFAKYDKSAITDAINLYKPYAVTDNMKQVVAFTEEQICKAAA